MVYNFRGPNEVDPRDRIVKIGKGYAKAAGVLLGIFVILLITDAIWRVWTGTPF